jgi:hypothetical protein
MRKIRSRRIRSVAARGKIVEAEDFVEQVFRDRQLKYCRDGRVSGGARRRRSMTGIGYGQTQPPSTM